MISLLIIVSVLFISSFALYLPLQLIFKTKKTSALVIPLSLSIEICFGTIFYILQIFKYFHPLYFFILFIVNCCSLAILIRSKSIPKINLLAFILLILACLPVFYTRLYPALSTIEPGLEDTITHLRFLEDIKLTGHIDNTFYIPGFHIVIYPLTYFLQPSQIYQFTGPILGIIIFFAIYLMIRPTLKNSPVRFLIPIIFSLPIFNLAIIQTVGFWPTSLVYLYLMTFIYTIWNQDILFYLIASLGLCFTVPYFFVQYVPTLMIIGTILFLWKKERKYLVYIFISVFCLAFLFLYTYAQTKIFSKSAYFPEINTSINTTNQAIATPVSNRQKSIDLIALIDKIIPSSMLRYTNSVFFKSYVAPSIITGLDAFTPKGIRYPFSPGANNTYLWLIISIISLFYSVKSKNKYGVIIFSVTIIFGIIAITGITEMTTYRGRTGVAYIFLASLGLLWWADNIYRQIFAPIYIAAVILSLYWIKNQPPAFTHFYCDGVFDIVNSINDQYPDQKKIIVTNYQQVSILSPSIVTKPLTKENIGVSNQAQTYIIYPKNQCKSDSIEMKNALSTDEYYISSMTLSSQLWQIEQDNINKVLNNPAIKNYSTYWENESIQVLKLIDSKL
ncbi:MAG: hypothetical protein WC069_02200 [Candidatus Shapirobacteria bacterium]